MLPKFSVKKPMTVVVGGIIVLALGVISFTGMTTDLFPAMNLPYAAVMTAYPGASPEQVEQTVVDPLEKSLASTSGLKNITSVSSENSGTVMLEFEQGVNMDTAMLDISAVLDQVKGTLPEGVSAPVPMRINPDMMPVVVAAASMDGKNLQETTDYLRETAIPTLERVDGVASVDATGLIEDHVSVALDQHKIDQLNSRLTAAVNAKLGETNAQLDQQQAQLDSAKQQLANESAAKSTELAAAQHAIDSGRSQLQLASTTLQMAQTVAQQGLDTVKPQLDQALRELAQLPDGSPLKPQAQQLVDKCNAAYADGQQQLARLQANAAQLQTQQQQLDQKQSQLDQGKTMLEQGLTEANNQIVLGQTALQQGRAQFEQAQESALQQAGLSGKLTVETLTQLLAAQNFSMPAGSIPSGNTEMTVKVGDKIASVDELNTLPLLDTGVEGIGVVRLSDVANVAESSNAGETYAKINGKEGILLTVQKQSTYSTSAVSEGLSKAIDKLNHNGSGLSVITLEDQGTYINVVVNSVLQNLILGGLLAMLILLAFLRTLKPTIVIACSIPISLLFAVVLMYFSGVTLNVISLAGLALGVGMLVDNSIVVIENIFRMRSQGASAIQAAVEGAKQVSGAITASTLTTVCVFLPIVFTTGMARDLFVDMGLTIAYSLLASLLVSLTLVPSMAATVMNKVPERSHRMFDRFRDFYGRLLRRALGKKILVLLTAAALFALSIFGAVTMGTEFMPETDSDQLMMTLKAPQDSNQQQLREDTDEVMDILSGNADIDTIGAMQSNSAGMFSTGSSSSMLYLLLAEDRQHTSTEIADQIRQDTVGVGCEVEVQSSGMDSSMLGGSGVSVTINGDDLDKLQQCAAEVAAIVRGTEGTRDITDGMENAGTEIRLRIDKEKAAAYQLTVGQVYQQLASMLSDGSEATTLSLEAGETPVLVAAPQSGSVTADNLLGQTLTGTQNNQSVSLSLGNIASTSEAQSLSAINHDNQRRTMSVAAEVDSAHNIGLVGREIQQKLDGYTPPAGCEIKLAGENETIDSTLFELLKMAALAIALVYLIMVAQFQSLLSPFIVMFTIPLAFTGGLLLLWATGFSLSVVAMLGFIVLAGVVVNNGIVFVDYTNQLRRQGMDKKDALVQAGMTRLRPILMTAITTILGLLTLAFGMGDGAEMLQPLGIVVIGGLAYATLLTLFVVPSLYDLFNRRPLKIKRIQELEKL